MPREELQWFVISDFRAGLIRRRSVRDASEGGIYATSLPPGAANIAKGCLPLDTGALGPGWKPDYTLAPDASMRAHATETNYITGFYVAQPVQVANSLREHEFWFGVEAIHSGTTRDFKLSRYRPFTPAWDGGLATQTSTVLPTTVQFKNTQMVTTRANRTTPANPGVPVVVIGHCAPTPTNPSNIWQFPNDTTPASNTILSLFTNSRYPSFLLAHQGRVVIFEQATYGHGAVGGWDTNEQLYYTIVNDTDTLETTTATIFTPENPAGYAVVASMSANELFAVKRFGGGVSINGDLADPTVINLPNVSSGTPCIPAHSPRGVIYLGANGGVFAWAGGDVSEHISRQLEDYFWKVSDGKNLDYQAILTPVGTDFVVTPKGFIYDIYNNSWWQLSNSSGTNTDGLWAFQQGFSAAQAPFLYGCKDRFTGSDTTTPIVYGWDTSKRVTLWDWEGQYHALAQGRQFVVREVIIDVSASAPGETTELTVGIGTFEDYQEAVIPAISGIQPQRKRLTFNVTGNHLQVYLYGNTNSVQPYAPTVHRVHVGWQEVNHLPTTYAA